jgi:hypothetical protein
VNSQDNCTRSPTLSGLALKFSGYLVGTVERGLKRRQPFKGYLWSRPTSKKSSLDEQKALNASFARRSNALRVSKGRRST